MNNYISFGLCSNMVNSDTQKCRKHVWEKKKKKKKQEILSQMSNSVSKECYGSFNIYVYI